MSNILGITSRLTKWSRREVRRSIQKLLGISSMSTFLTLMRRKRKKITRMLQLTESTTWLTTLSWKKVILNSHLQNQTSNLQFTTSILTWALNEKIQKLFRKLRRRRTDLELQSDQLQQRKVILFQWLRRWQMFRTSKRKSKKLRERS